MLNRLFLCQPFLYPGSCLVPVHTFLFSSTVSKFQFELLYNNIIYCAEISTSSNQHITENFGEIKFGGLIGLNWCE